MVVAKLSNGGLILGVSRENVNRLLEGKPIRVTRETHGVHLPPGQPMIAIVFGETEQDITRNLLTHFNMKDQPDGKHQD